MKLFISILFSWFAVFPAFAAPCNLDAASLVDLREQLQWTFQNYSTQDHEMVFKTTAVPECLKPAEWDVELDQEVVKGWLPQITMGIVLSGRVSVENGLARVRLSATEEVLWLLEHGENTRANLQAVVKGFRLRSWAVYQTTAFTSRSTEIADLARRCSHGVSAKMACADFLGWDFTTIPDCLRNPLVAAQFRAAFQVEDPFLSGQDERLRISGVAHNLCGSSGRQLPWAIAAGDQVLFGGGWIESRKTISLLSRLSLSGRILW